VPKSCVVEMTDEDQATGAVVAVGNGGRSTSAVRSGEAHDAAGAVALEVDVALGELVAPLTATMPASESSQDWPSVKLMLWIVPCASRV
jgi:hypothetical protein